MNKYEVLDKVYNKKINKKKAYKLLYKEKDKTKERKAKFIKLRINLPNEKGVNTLLKVLLGAPIPLFLVKSFVSRRQSLNLGDNLELSGEEVASLLSIKGIEINVVSKDKENILIKTI